MVLTGVNVDHDQFVELAQKHFVGAQTSWDGVEPVAVDESISQYTSGEVRVCSQYISVYFRVCSSISQYTSGYVLVYLSILQGMF